MNVSLEEFYKTHVDSVIVSTKEIESLYKMISILTEMNNRLRSDLNSSDKIVIYPGTPGLGIYPKVNKGSEDYTIEFIKDYIGRYEVNKDNSQRVLELLSKFIGNKLDEFWFTKRFKRIIMKSLKSI